VTDESAPVDPPRLLAALSPLERLEREPTRFSLDQAAAVIAPGCDPTEISFGTRANLGAPAGEVIEARPDSRELTTPTFGLIGAGGVLPRHYTALIDTEARKRSTALHRFVDMLARRFTGLYIKAGAKYKPLRDPKTTEQVLAAVAGLGTPNLTSALTTQLPAVLYYAGVLAARTRSAERLRGMLAEETGNDVSLVEFVGGWVRLPPGEQSRLAAPGEPGRHVQLGVDATAGSQVWDPSSRFLVRLGPLTLTSFEALLPGAALHGRLVELVRLHVGLEQDFAFNPVLAASEVPPLRLGASGLGAARLSWSSWLTSPLPRTAAATEATLRATPG
jgi:type VI secretion system protein ImpH